MKISYKYFYIKPIKVACSVLGLGYLYYGVDVVNWYCFIPAILLLGLSIPN